MSIFDKLFGLDSDNNDDLRLTEESSLEDWFANDEKKEKLRKIQQKEKEKLRKIQQKEKVLELKLKNNLDKKLEELSDLEAEYIINPKQVVRYKSTRNTITKELEEIVKSISNIDDPSTVVPGSTVFFEGYNGYSGGMAEVVEPQLGAALDDRVLEILNKKINSKVDKVANKFSVNLPIFPTEKTGDRLRFDDLIKELKKKNISNKYLYLIQIRSRVDNKNYIKIGLTSKNNIEDRFEDDTVVDLIEKYKFVNFNSLISMTLEYNLIRKYRPKNYFAEEEFDEFSKFSGYTEVVPMKHINNIVKDIDAVIDNHDEINNLFNYIVERDKKNLLLTKQERIDRDFLEAGF